MVATGALAIVKFRSFSRPFINVSLEASSRPCSQDYVQIGVAAKLSNGSQNTARVGQLEWECRGIAIYPSEAIEQKTDEYFKDDGGNARTEYGNSDFPWNLQQRITKKGLAHRHRAERNQPRQRDIRRAELLHGGADTIVHPNQAQKRHGMDRRHLPRHPTNIVGGDMANPFRRADRHGAPSIRPTPPGVSRDTDAGPN